MARRREMPTLGLLPKKKSRLLPKLILLALVGGAIYGGVTWLRNVPEDRGLPRALEKARLVLEVLDGGDPSARAAAAALSDQAGLPAAGTPAPDAPPPDPLAAAGLKHVHVEINGPLETAIVAAAGSETGPALTQVVTRALIWWVDMPSGLQRGDVLDVLYQERSNDEPVVHAVRFESQKLGKTVEAYRYKGATNAYARFYQPSGEELELRLEDAPLDNYEQITSLLRDGRRHKGVDFKVEVGAPVRATFDGVVTRRNWNFRGNGNSLEITEPGGRRKALYLHLSELPGNIRVGTRVKKGDVIAQSGNSGRSFAPHLHYQLMAGETKVLDPFDVHRSWRRALDTSDKSAFEAEVRRYETLFSSRRAQR